MFKIFEKLRKPISLIALIAMITVSLIVGIGECVDAGTLFFKSFTFALVLGVCLVLYFIGMARDKAFPVLVAVITMIFIFLLNPFMEASMFEVIGWAFNNNAALGLAEILYLILVLGGIAVLVLYILENIFGFKLSVIINFMLLGLLAVALTYFFLRFIGVIISLANNTGASWYDLLSPILVVGGYLFVFVNFSFLEAKTSNI